MNAEETRNDNPPQHQHGHDRLAELFAPQRDRVDAPDVGIVFAHPDDETISCGAQLPRWTGASLVLMTDGAPVNLKDAHKLGFATASEYAAERSRELGHALAIAGVAADRLLTLDIPDQQVARQLVSATRRLVDIMKARDLDVIFTHAYEGGHPDHDATAFAVHAAARLREAAGHPVLVLEMPFYQAGDGGMTRQHFAPADDAPEITVHLSPHEQALKRRMMAAHRSQAAILGPFEVKTEHFRVAPRYDFTKLPNEGRLLYESEDWGMTGAEWLVLARAALSDLGL